MHYLDLSDKETNSANGQIFTSEYIAPWALPKEEIPVHLVWKPTIRFDHIQILLTPDMTIKEFYNVDQFERLNSEIKIRKLYTPNFFGFVVSTIEQIKQSHEQREITINFMTDGKIQHSRIFTANIYRPELSIVEKPDVIVLKDNSKLDELVTISLGLSGFGNIEITTELEIGGKFEPNVEPLFQEMTRRLTTTFRSDIPSLEKKSKIKINPEFVKKTTQAFIESIRKGEAPLTMNGADVADFKKWIQDDSNQEKIVKVVSEHLENILIDSLLYYFNRYPTEGVALSGGSPSVIIKSADENLKLRFKYRDSLRNEYEPVLVEIAVKDSRTRNRDRELKIPVNIKWVHRQINPTPLEVKC
jgi:hypothetical protein